VKYFEGYHAKLEDVHCFWWSSYLLHGFVRNDNGARSPLAKNLEAIPSAYQAIPYEGPVTPIVGPQIDLPVDDTNPNLFQNQVIEDWVTNWTREELEQVLPIATKTTIVKQSGTCRMETTRPIPGLSQQIFTYTQDEDSSLDSDSDDNTNHIAWFSRLVENSERLSRSTKTSERDKPYTVLSPIFKQLVVAVEKDNGNLKECAAELVLNLVATIEGKVAKLLVKEEGMLALPTSKRK
jgi:hypothetical protein